jgi:hypothetical protein
MKSETLPMIGEGATVAIGSDRRACTIIFSSPTRLVVQQDIATRIDTNGMSESQTYTYERNPTGPTYTFSKRGNGRWGEVGTRGGGVRLAIGHRCEYYDFSF